VFITQNNPSSYYDAAATKSPSADVLVFDYTKHPSRPTDSAVRPNLRLKGHEKEGYGIAWSPLDQGKIISAGDDKLVCLWDIGTGTPGGAAAGASGPVLQAARKFAAHSDVVEDVTWHRHHKDLFASCGDDSNVFM
jgi:WD40 repeat protein